MPTLPESLNIYAYYIQPFYEKFCKFIKIFQFNCQINEKNDKMNIF